MIIRGTLYVLKDNYYLIKPPFKYPIMSEAVKERGLTKADKGRYFEGELNETIQRITKVY